MTDRNRHEMPFLVELDDGVERIWDAIRARKRHFAFPRPLSSLVWALQVAPRWLYDWLGSRAEREKAD